MAQTRTQTTRIAPGVYAVTIGSQEYRIRRERDEAGERRWFAFGDGPNNPIAAGHTLRACVTDMARYEGTGHGQPLDQRLADFRKATGGTK